MHYIVYASFLCWLVVGFFCFQGFLVASTAEWLVALCFSEQDTLIAADGTVTDVSDQLFDEFDLLSLLPSAIVEFKDSDGGRVIADYEFSYKNKI